MRSGQSEEASERGRNILKGAVVGIIIVLVILWGMQHGLGVKSAAVRDGTIYWTGDKAVSITSQDTTSSAVGKLVAAGNGPLPGPLMTAWGLILVYGSFFAILIGGIIAIFGGFEMTLKGPLGFTAGIGLVIPFLSLVFVAIPVVAFPLAAAWGLAWAADARSKKKVAAKFSTDFREQEQCVPIKLTAKKLGINGALALQMVTAEIPLLLFYTMVVGFLLLSPIGLWNPLASLGSALLLSAAAHAYAWRRNSFFLGGEK